jgi:uncharacterized membrane protein
MPFLFPYHPRLVHIPIALGLVGAASLAFGLLRGRQRWTEYGQITLVLTWIGLLLAAASGLIDQSRAPDTPGVANAINQHITVGVGLIVVFGLILYWPLRDRKLLTAGRGKRWGYLALLALGAAMLILEAWLGGGLVYKMGVGVASH